ncbi:MAG: ABC transporter permease [Thermomicrobiales bacterium]|nr:ABC transporter permease [Thermomicrobiales bacterium]MCO5218611.1 ABC transporter permease [Thermomicrobiales bacterium]MCO5224288.1 ABC transporter permease [Thermomicrobiales bacterium]
MFLALREFKHAKLRYALVSAIIVLVASLVFILSALANGLATGQSEAIDAIDADGFVVATGSEYLLDRSRLPAETLDQVREANGVEEAQPLLASANNVRIGDQDGVLGVSILGVDPGSFLDPGNGLEENPDGAVIDQSMANEGVGVGDVLRFEPSGVEIEVVGIVDGHEYRLIPTLFVSLDTYVQIVPDAKDTYSAIAVRGDYASLADSVEGVMVGSRDDLVTGLPGYQEQAGTLLMIQGFLVVIAAGIIAAFFFIITLQKMSELGVMKALGATTFTLATALVIQSVILSVIGILVGIVVSWLLQSVLEGTVPYRVQSSQMILYGTILLVVAVAGTLLSLFRIARVDPLDAINRAN